MAAPVAGVKRSFAAMAAEPTSPNSHRQRASGYVDGNTVPRIRDSVVDSANSSPGGHSATRSSSSSPRVRSTRESTPLIFEPDASIVLIGIRGSGKSTLAIIASTAMKRRIVDAEKAFQEACGLSTHAFKKTHGNLECQRRQCSVLQGILTKCPKDCIIVSSWMERSVQVLLEDFAVSHPVIHVMRDQESIASYLGVTDEGKLQELLNFSASTFRSCCNLEFFNISEVPPRRSDETTTESAAIIPDGGEQKAPAPYLTLKRAERHFLKFLSLVLPEGSIPYAESAFPLASIATEKRQFTYAMSVPLSKLLSHSLDVEDFETGADAIEIVVDDLFTHPHRNSRLSPDRASQISRVVGHIRRNAVIPIIMNVVWPSDGAIEDYQRLIYLEHVQHSLRLAPEYITIDLRLEDRFFSHVVANRRSSKVIGSVNLKFNPPSWASPIWISLYRKAVSLGCDLVRLLRPATQVEDNFEIHSMRQAVKADGMPQIPLIAFNTGPKGRNSQCFNRIMTSVIPEPLAGMKEESPSYVPPALTAFQATSALHSSFIIDAMKLYVFGANVGFSLSPAMHSAALKACGVPHEYTPRSTDSLSNIRDLIHDPLFAGASIGLPFKVEVISLTHSLSSHAKAIGAVNTLIPIRQLNADNTIPDNALLFNDRNRSGPVLALYGENTDWIGVRACIRRGLSPANAVRPSTSGLVIGAGGMARAAVYSMLQLGVQNIAIYNRTAEHADKLVSHFMRLLARHDIPSLSPSTGSETRFHVLRSRDEAWPDTFRLPTMVVSCIPTHSVGGCPPPDFTLPEAWMQSPTGGVVLEYAYLYLNTPLLNQVRAEAYRGWVAMDGLDILPEQGFAQFELFTGRRAPRRLMRAEVFKSYPDAQGEKNQTQLQPRLDDVVEQEP